MQRRRRRLVCSSDDEEEDELERRPQQQNRPPQDNTNDDDYIEVELQEPTLNLESVALNSSSSSSNPNPNPNPNPVPSEPIPLEISDDDDDDLMDIPENPSPPPPPPTAEQSFPSFSGESSGCPISDFLGRLGLRLRREWLDSCIGGLESSVHGFASLNVEAKAKLCFEQFLCSDMNCCGGGALPENVHSMHLVDLTGPFVLQVDEIINLSCPLKERYKSAPSGIKRCLKLSMTDGVQRVFGMEYRPIKDLEVMAPAGLKVAIRNANVRHGILMLVPEVLEVLGGVVEELEAARQRLVQEINKPPRGKRTRTGVVPPLATRATLAAWPQNNVSSPGHNNNSTLQAAMPMQEDVPGTASGVSASGRNTQESAVPISRENAEDNPSSISVADVEEIHMVDEVEHPFILSGDREIPFTYLASLSAKWAAMQDTASNVQGKIKCFLTGVKSFQYKRRTTFELRVYVDDGSLISEVLIDHNVVQRGIGHSPEEVTGALTSSDSKRVSDMKETMKQFQIFLVNFEGTMIVKMSKASPIPVSIEMNQGSPASDAWMLLRRLQSSSSSQPPQQPYLNPINLSP